MFQAEEKVVCTIRMATTADPSDREQVYFAMVDLVRSTDDCILEPDLAGAFTHVAARATDRDAFLAIVTEAASEMGLSLHDVEWVATSADLSRTQANSAYYHDLIPQLERQPVGWAEFQCYPHGRSDEDGA